ncbi:MAG: AAA family ATPase [Dyadobacter sp.]|uniref:AAA family ATPase n=1 Tax=Dyadobacter sp. TaxID=1914288 RepID=UPI003266367E
MNIQSLFIEKLFGVKDVRIPFYDNKIILVGENGAGKTTILRIIYLFLAKQWKSLKDYEFNKIEMIIDNCLYVFSHDQHTDESVPTSVINKLAGEYPTYRDFIHQELPKYTTEQLLNDDTLVSGLDGNYDIPISLIFSIMKELEKVKTGSPKFPWKVNLIYLPTYRRIERSYEILYGDIGKRLAQHIKQLFPEINYKIQDEKNSSEPSRFSETETDILGLFDAIWTKRDFERWTSRLDKNFHLELIEFGMEDVRYHIQNLLSDPKNDHIVKNYLEVCNRYLSSDKKIISASKTMVLAVEFSVKKDLQPLDILSAGEKQILSLFSYLLTAPEETYVIIDEPELSLSIAWQEMILTDIIKFNIAGLIIATHSPFMITPKLKLITHGVNEFIEQ